MRRYFLMSLGAASALVLTACDTATTTAPDIQGPLLQIMGDLPTNQLFNQMTGVRVVVREDRLFLLVDLRISASLIEARKGSFRLYASARLIEDGGQVGFIEQQADVEAAVGQADPVDGMVNATIRLPIDAATWAKLQAATSKTDPLDELRLEASLFVRLPSGQRLEVARANAVDRDGTVFIDLGRVTFNAPAVTQVVDRPMHFEINPDEPLIVIEVHVARDLLQAPSGTIALRSAAAFLEDGTALKLDPQLTDIQNALVVGTPAVPPAAGYTAVAVKVGIDQATWDALHKLAGPDDPVDEIRVRIGVILRFPDGQRFELGRVNGVEKDGGI